VAYRQDFCLGGASNAEVEAPKGIGAEIYDYLILKWRILMHIWGIWRIHFKKFLGRLGDAPSPRPLNTPILWSLNSDGLCSSMVDKNGPQTERRTVDRSPESRSLDGQVFLTTFGLVVTMTFDLWPFNLQLSPVHLCSLSMQWTYVVKLKFPQTVCRPTTLFS